MASLGEFEVAVRDADPDREPDTFTLCGEVFTVSDRDLTVSIGRFARTIRPGMDSSDMESVSRMIGLLEAVVIDDDKQRFLDTAESKGADSELLFKIVAAVIEANTGRPTGQPSDSSDGSSTTGASSRALSPSVAWADSPLGRRELAARADAFADVVPLSEAGKQVLRAG
jgi:hypothetical protein